MNPFLGPKYLLRGFRLIFKPGLRRFFLIPLLVNIVVFTVLILFFYDGFDMLLNWMLPDGESAWISIVRSVLWVIFTGAALIIVFFTFTVIANLIGAPFNGILSEKVELYLTGETITDNGGIKEALASIWPGLENELRKLLYFITLAFVIFLLSLIPLINIAAPVIWFFFGAWMLSLEYLSYPMENQGIVFKEVRARVAEKRLLALSFGFAVVIVTLIPIVNFFIMPSAVAGATILWVENWKQSGKGKIMFRKDQPSATGKKGIPTRP